MKTKQELRQSLENKARRFWDDFNYQLETDLIKNYKQYEGTPKSEPIEYLKSQGYTLENALKNRLLTEDDIDVALGRASIAGLNIMTSRNSKKYPNYKSCLESLTILTHEFSASKAYLLHYFDKGIFDEESAQGMFIVYRRVQNILTRSYLEKFKEEKRNSEQYSINEQIISDIDSEITKQENMHTQPHKEERKDTEIYPINELINYDADLEITKNELQVLERAS